MSDAQIETAPETRPVAGDGLGGKDHVMRGLTGQERAAERQADLLAAAGARDTHPAHVALARREPFGDFRGGKRREQPLAAAPGLIGEILCHHAVDHVLDGGVERHRDSRLRTYRRLLIHGSPSGGPSSIPRASQA